MRDEGDHQFGLVFLNTFAAEEAPEAGNTCQPGNAGDGSTVGLLHDAADDVDFSVAEADIGEGLVLADDGLGNATDIDTVFHLRHVEVDVEGNFTVVVDFGIDFEVDADINEGELGINERVHADADASDTGLEAAGSGGDFVSDFDRRLGVISRADLRGLHDTGAGVGQNRFELGTGKVGEGIVTRGNVAQPVEREIRAGGSGSRRGAGSGGGCGGSCSAGRENGVGRDAGGREGGGQFADVGTGDLHHDDVDDDFGTWFVEIGDELFDERHSVGFGAHNKGVLGGEIENLLDINDGAENGEDFLHFLGGGHVAEVKHLHHLVGIFTTLGGIVDGHEDGAGGKRLPIRLGNDGDLVEGFVESGAIEVHLGLLEGLLLVVFGIEEDIDAGDFADGFEEDAGAIGHFQVNRVGIEGTQFGDGQKGIGAVLRVTAGEFGRGHCFTFRSEGDGRFASILVALNHVAGTPDLLDGDGGGGIDAVGLFKFRERFFELAFRAQLLADFHMGGAGFEAQTADEKDVGGICGVF